MTEAHCADCGARYDGAEDSCQLRFDALLALDHSHTEPWGSRHAIAFATYALQHPTAHTDATRSFSRELLRRVFQRHEPLAQVVADFRARDISPRSSIPTADIPPHGGPFTVTISDLGDFEASGYPEALERWALATLDRVG